MKAIGHEIRARKLAFRAFHAAVNVETFIFHKQISERNCREFNQVDGVKTL